MVSLHFCTSDSWGGLEIYASTLMVELQKLGCDVISICKPSSKIQQFLTANGVRCEHFSNNRKISLSSLRLIRNIIEQRNVEVLHVHFHRDIWIPSIVLKDDSQRKLFLSVYMGVTSKNDIFHRWIYRRVNAIFSSSEELNSRLHTLYPVAKEKIHYLPYGRKLELYSVDQHRRRSIRSKLNVGEDEMLVGTMVRIDPGKGAMDFARSFLYLDKALQARVKYVIVGEPTRKSRAKANESPYEPPCEAYLQQLEAFITKEKLSDRIILAGFQEDLTGYLGAMDVFVFPSRDELYSLVVLDAMGMGLPVVAARAGGNLRQIEDGSNGLLYNVADSSDLADKLSTYIKNPELRKQHGQSARQFVEKTHSMNNTIHLLKNFYAMDRSGLNK